MTRPEYRAESDRTDLGADPAVGPGQPGTGDRLTLQEYALRHHPPLELAIDRAELGREDRVGDYPAPRGYPSEQARAVLRGLDWAGLIREEGAADAAR